MKNYDGKTINKRIAHYRRLMQLTQEDVAKKMGMRSSTYAQKERTGMISCQFLVDLSNILGVSTNVLLFGETPTDNVDLSQLVLTNREEDIIKMYRAVTHCNKDIIYAFICDVFKNK